MITKDDWDTVLKENEKEREQLLHNYEMTLPQIDAVIREIKLQQKLAPDREEVIPEPIKEVIKEAIK